MKLLWHKERICIAKSHGNSQSCCFNTPRDSFLLELLMSLGFHNSTSPSFSLWGLMSSASSWTCYSLGFCPLRISLPRVSLPVTALLVTCTAMAFRLVSPGSDLTLSSTSSYISCLKFTLFKTETSFPSDIFSFPTYTLSISDSTVYPSP